MIKKIFKLQLFFDHTSNSAGFNFLNIKESVVNVCGAWIIFKDLFTNYQLVLFNVFLSSCVYCLSKSVSFAWKFHLEMTIAVASITTTFKGKFIIYCWHITFIWFPFHSIWIVLDIVGSFSWTTTITEIRKRKSGFYYSHSVILIVLLLLLLYPQQMSSECLSNTFKGGGRQETLRCLVGWY